MGVADAAAVDRVPHRRWRPHARRATSSSRSRCSASARARGAVLRSGARAGDALLVTGPLGRAAAGLRRRAAGAALDDPLVVAHRRPWPRLDEGLAAAAPGRTR